MTALFNIRFPEDKKGNASKVRRDPSGWCKSGRKSWADWTCWCYLLSIPSCSMADPRALKAFPMPWNSCLAVVWHLLVWSEHNLNIPWTARSKRLWNLLKISSCRSLQKPVKIGLTDVSTFTMTTGFRDYINAKTYEGTWPKSSKLEHKRMF